MRRFNAVLSAAILILFVLHSVFGAWEMIGVSDSALKIIAWTDAALILIHAAIGVKLTADTIRAQKLSGVSYGKENLLFWARRLSGFAIFIFLFFHIMSFSTRVDGALRLKAFDGVKLAAELLLVASIAVHVISNVRPMLISFGIPALKPRAREIIFALSLILIFAAVGFIVYYLRWNVW